MTFNQHLLDGLSNPPEHLQWQQLREGVDVAWIYRSEDGGAAAYLRYQPGAEVPLHRHPDTEHIFVISGEQEDRSGKYPAGSIVINPPETKHAVWSPNGCIVFVIWAKQVEFLE